MESTTQSKSKWFLGIFLFPIVLVVLFFFSLYSLRHRKQYKGSEEYSSRFFFLKRIYWLIYQLFPQKDLLDTREQLNLKNSLIVLYSKSFSFFLVYLAFLVSDFYEKNYQTKKSFRLCNLYPKKLWWEFLFSSVEVFRRIPSVSFLRETNESVVYFSNSISSLEEIVKNSYRTIVFFKLEKFFSWSKGFNRTYIAVGKATLKERLKNLEEFNLKVGKIFSLLEEKN